MSSLLSPQLYYISKSCTLTVYPRRSHIPTLPVTAPAIVESDRENYFTFPGLETSACGACMILAFFARFIYLY
jgi:hypothetical protein